jgi:hypothetical protein
MPRLFPPWSDTAFRVVLVGVVTVGALAVIGPMVYMRTPYAQNREYPVDQPVPFDHRHHVEDDNIDCRFCHGGAEKSAYAGVPSTEVCMGCHNQVWPESPMLEPVRRSFFTDRSLPWNRVHRVPDFVYFDHSIHVNKGVGCYECHGNVAGMALDRQVAPLTMGWCLGCHRDPAPRLRPLETITAMRPSDPAEGARVAAALGVRKLTHCTACHR